MSANTTPPPLVMVPIHPAILDMPAEYIKERLKLLVEQAQPASRG